MVESQRHITTFLFLPRALSIPLQIGDRIVSVNGDAVSGRSYAQVVQMIQKSRDLLYLVVVPRQDDILQVVSSPHSN